MNRIPVRCAGQVPGGPAVQPDFRGSAFFERVLNALPAMTAVLDHRGTVVWVNRAWREFARSNGYRGTDHGIGRNYLHVCKQADGDDAEDGRLAAAAIRRVLAGRDPAVYLDYPCFDGDKPRWFQLRVTALPWRGQTWALVCHENVTERKLAELDYQHAAEHDALTGLANRQYLVRRLQETLDAVGRGEHAQFALMFIDFDRFKVINDTLGHDVGDRVLRSVSQRIKERLPAGAMAARLGGDEFVILMEAVDDPSAVTRLAHEVQTALAEPHRIGEHELRPTISVGIVIGDRAYTQPKDVLRDADLAMYEAKHGGRDRYMVFDPDLREEAMRRLTSDGR